jgi:hypothetical protein
MATGAAGLPLAEQRYFWRELQLRKGGRQLARERKKSFFMPRAMNSRSLVWASYCSSIADFQWFVEADGACFCCLLLILCCFWPNIQSDKDALTSQIVIN